MASLPELLLAPALVGAALAAAQRWGPRIGGLCSAFPAIVGPLLLIAFETRGAAFAARTANSVLLGLAGLAAFTLAYGWTARRAGWRVSVAIGWGAAALTGFAVGRLAGSLAFPGGLCIAVVALSLAGAAMPRVGSVSAARRAPLRARRYKGREILARMLWTVVLVAVLAAAAQRFGAVVGGVLAGLPVLASVLATCTHARNGRDAVLSLLRGILGGMASFVGFCAVVALLIMPAGAPAAFAAATAAAVGLQALALAGWRVQSSGRVGVGVAGPLS